jgi:hypothetical protein
MPATENSLATQRHMRALCNAAEHALYCHPREFHKRIKPGFDGTIPESWEKPVYIKATYKHPLPPDLPEMAFNERPTDADAIEREYSLLRISSGPDVVLEMMWNEKGWFGHIEPGAWEVIFINWTHHWWQCEGDDIAATA